LILESRPFKIVSIVMAVLLCVRCNNGQGSENASQAASLESAPPEGAPVDGGETGDGEGGRSDDAVGKRPKTQTQTQTQTKTQTQTHTKTQTQTSTSTSTNPSPPKPSQKPEVKPDTAGCIDGDDFTCKAEAALVRYTNAIRAKASLAPLRHEFKVSFVARDWSTQQGASISHDGFPTARVSVYQQRFPDETVPRISGENVAMFTGAGADPEVIAKTFADMWENSPGHYANIVGGHAAIGVGIKCARSGAQGGGGFGGGSLCTGTQIFSK
jgi:uncharacterized protein YkwD